MNQKIKNQIRYKSNSFVNQVDEIIIGRNYFSKTTSFNYDTLELFKPKLINKKNIVSNINKNTMLNFSILSFIIIASFVFIVKIVSSSYFTFNNFATTLFITGYFLLFGFIVFLISKRKKITLKIKNGELYIKSFPTLNKKIPTNAILKCEVNALKEGTYNSNNKIHFALNEEGNKYKQLLSSGIALQFRNGNHIFIGSNK